MGQCLVLDIAFGSFDPLEGIPQPLVELTLGAVGEPTLDSGETHGGLEGFDQNAVEGSIHDGLGLRWCTPRVDCGDSTV